MRKISLPNAHSRDVPGTHIHFVTGLSSKLSLD
jgi:hypothetical protein